MKTLYEKPDEPNRVFIKTRKNEFEATEHFSCAHCTSIHRERQMAIACCQKPQCDECGAFRERYTRMCRDCAEKKEQGEMAAAAIAPDYDGPVWAQGEQEFYENIEDYMGSCDTDPATRADYVFAVEQKSLLDHDADSLLATIASDLGKDWLPDDADEAEFEMSLRKAIGPGLKAWLRGQGDKIRWKVDRTRKVKVPWPAAEAVMEMT